MTTRALVVGAGVGGLAAAIELAARGVEVEVVEKASRPGGKLRQVEVAGAAMDAGPTVFTMRWVFDALFARAGTRLDDHLSLSPLSVLARHAWSENERLDLHADVAASADAIGNFAGASAARGYLAFCDRARAIFETLDETFMRQSRPNPVSLAARVGARGLAGLTRIAPFHTLWQELGRYFLDPRLRQLFGRYATYCGSSPFDAPATLMLVAHVEQAGVWTVEGGLHAVARALAALAGMLGARIRCEAEVKEIVVRGGRAAGVRLASGETLSADAVVFNGDASALGAGLLGSAVLAAAPRCEPARRSLSALTWNLRVRTGGFPLARHSVFFSDDYRREFDEIFGARRLPSNPSVYVCAQDRAEHAAPPDGPERLLLIVNAPANGDLHALTAEEIHRCETRTFAQLARCGLTMTHGERDSLTTTPEDFDRMFPATGGALYGPASHGWQASFSRPGARSRLPGLYLAGGSVHPGPGVPMAALSGASGGREPDRRPAAGDEGAPAFDVDVAHGGYVWWYLDALSDDGRHGLTVIAFLGSVFSPYYAWARRQRNATFVDPLEHCAVNVALYGRAGGGGPKRWTMTERGRSQVERDATSLRIGPSRLRCVDGRLVIDLDEIGMPWPQRVRGTVVVDPMQRFRHTVWLSERGRHRWFPTAPGARVEVRLSQPGVSWSGDAYLDANQGDAPLEDAFDRWDWSRAHLRDGRAAVFYDVERLDGERVNVALGFGKDGVRTIDRPPPCALPPSRWRVPRATRSDGGHPPRVVQTLTDAPFYARSLVDANWSGERVTAMHESLSMPRFVSPWVQAMLPFRVPRTTR